MRKHTEVDRKQRKGLTLLELVVVMAILVGLAAILIPLLPEFVGKANQSAGATNLGELEKAIMMFRAEYNRYPNHYDSLINAANDGISDIVPNAPTGKFGGGNLEPRAITKGQLSRLSREGIKTVYDLVESADLDADTAGTLHATLHPYVQSHGSGRALAEDDLCVFLTRQTDGSYNDDVLDRSVMPGVILNPDHDYIVLGIGKYCNLCGPDGIVKEAPIFGQHKQQNTPAEAYQRFCAVYDVGEPNDDTSKVNAKFVGCVAIVGKRLFTSGDLVGTYHDNRFNITKPVE